MDSETLSRSAGERLPVVLVPDHGLRPVNQSDVDELGHLYFQSYDPGEACATVEAARDDIAASFAGEYGDFWWDASVAAVNRSGQIVGCIKLVTQASWDAAPEVPFIIELFVDRGVSVLAWAKRWCTARWTDVRSCVAGWSVCR